MSPLARSPRVLLLLRMILQPNLPSKSDTERLQVEESSHHLLTREKFPSTAWPLPAWPLSRAREASKSGSPSLRTTVFNQHLCCLHVLTVLLRVGMCVSVLRASAPSNLRRRAPRTRGSIPTCEQDRATLSNKQGPSLSPSRASFRPDDVISELWAYWDLSPPFRPAPPSPLLHMKPLSKKLNQSGFFFFFVVLFYQLRLVERPTDPGVTS